MAGNNVFERSGGHHLISCERTCACQTALKSSEESSSSAGSLYLVIIFSCESIASENVYFPGLHVDYETTSVTMGIFFYKPCGLIPNT